ncbi:glycosyltransferase family 4 protein [Aeromonas veronii]
MNKLAKHIYICTTILPLKLSLLSESLARLWVTAYIKRNNKNSIIHSRLFFQKAKDKYPFLALECGKLFISQYFDPSFNAVYANRLKRAGYDHEAMIIESEIDNLDKKIPNRSNIDSVYQVLSDRKDILNASKWHNFLTLRDKNAKLISSKKLFIYFKDINTSIACAIGKEYLLSNPSDIKFAQVFLKRAKKVMSPEDYKCLSIELLDTNSANIYVVNSASIIANDVIEEFGEDIVALNHFKVRTKEKLQNTQLLKAMFNSCKDKYSPLSAYLAKALADTPLDCMWSRKIADYYLSIGSISLAKKVIFNAELSELVVRKQKSIASFSELINYRFGNINQVNCFKDYKAQNNSVLYLMHNRLPYNSGGYATRSHGVLTAIDKYWNVQGVSRLGFPQDRKGFENEPYICTHTIDSINYHALKAEGNAFGQIPLGDYIDEYAKELSKQCLQEKPAIIHAASNYMNGLAGVKVAKQLGIKSVYEVRGLWEVTRISREPEWKGSEYYEMMVNLEAQAAINADHVFTLTSALKEELISRGVDASKIDLLPNGVDSTRFIPKPRNEKLAEDVGVTNKVVIGFLGSVVQYEGVEYIIEATSILKKRGVKNFSTLIVGDGAVIDQVKDLSSNLCLDDLVIFTGRVPHDHIEDYYSIVDICPLPRKGLPVCEMVSPLKPFEAMAMGKAVISSDVAALAEIVQDGVTGLLHQKDNAEDLANKLQMLIEQPELRNKYGTAAREWVVAERDWKVLAQRVDAVYKKLLSHDGDEKIA